MENSNLNASHRYGRLAQKLFYAARFDEAIMNHELARKKIEEAMLTVTMPRVLESLRCQRDFHTKQIDLIIIRREQHEKCAAAQAVVDQGLTFRRNLEDSRQVQVQLFKSLDDAEKVVEVLEQKTVGGGGGSSRETSELLSKLFEDLKLLNQQNLLYVNSLVSQLDKRVQENEELREVLDRRQRQGEEQRTEAGAGRGSREEESDAELNRLEELAPLELPTFDFNTFSAMGKDGEAEGGETLRRIGFGSLHAGIEAQEDEE